MVIPMKLVLVQVSGRMKYGLRLKKGGGHLEKLLMRRFRILHLCFPICSKFWIYATATNFPLISIFIPAGDWYFRIIPRIKILGGFELGTGIMVNTQDPKETIAFIKEHFHAPDVEKIRREHQAEYSKHA